MGVKEYFQILAGYLFRKQNRAKKRGTEKLTTLDDLAEKEKQLLELEEFHNIYFDHEHPENKYNKLFNIKNPAEFNYNSLTNSLKEFIKMKDVGKAYNSYEELLEEELKLIEENKADDSLTESKRMRSEMNIKKIKYLMIVEDELNKKNLRYNGQNFTTIYALLCTLQTEADALVKELQTLAPKYKTRFGLKIVPTTFI